MRNFAITLMSILLTTVVIGNAYYQKKQFYPSVVYITKSNPSMAIIYIQAFIVVIIMGKLMRRIFFGELRAVELEHLMERSWYAITETCLAFTVFRDDFNSKFLALFTLLLFLKAFHWLADERVDYMERSPVISWLFHIRIISLLSLLGVLDVLFVCHAYQSTLNKGASVQLVFGFEYAILLTIVLNIVIKYAFHINDFNELPWENKAVFLLYTELIMGFIKVILYFSFVIIMVRIYTLPLFAFRPMYYTVRAFKKAVNDVVMSRRAIRNMNTLYPDATAEELSAMDNVCIICREEMRSAAKKLPCNHIFHTSCLRSWFQRQQTCPTCRLNILRTPTTAAGGGQGVAAAAAGGEGAAPPAGGVAAAGGGGGGGAGAGMGAVVGGNVGGGGNGGPAAVGAAAAGIIPPAVGGLGQIPRLRDRTAQTNTDTSGTTAGQLPRYRDRTAQTNGAAGSTSATLNTTDNSNAGTSAGSFIFPPSPSFTVPENVPLIPPFPFMAFNVPPPMPPPEGLSDEELRRLEDDTREGMEHRIRCLYTIQAMLDTSVLMMQQYCAAVAAGGSNYSTIPQRLTTVAQDIASSSGSTADKTEISTTVQTSSRAEEDDGNSSNSEVSSVTFLTKLTTEDTTTISKSSDEDLHIDDDMPIVSTISDRNADSLETAASSSSSDNSKTSSKQEMLRQRRLEKFSKN